MRTSSLINVHHKGIFGNFEGKDKNSLLKIKELKNLKVYQIVKYKKSKIDLLNISFDTLKLPETLKVSFNQTTRIIWMGPNNWILVSENKELEQNINNSISKEDFAITDLSHSRTIIEIEGDLVTEVIKKGCPLNIENLKAGNCSNSVFHAITITLDFVSDDPKKIRIFALRSFGESLYHSITDASLEFGFQSI